jgi:hypothetical protein
MPNWVDLALIRLETPVNSIDPIPLYTDTNETGALVTFYGTGSTGDGNVGVTTRDNNLRMAHNRVDSVEDDWLIIPFDAPPNAEPLEGISGPGDSGGPAIISIDGVDYLAGVSSRNDASGLALCSYGTVERYARVSSHAQWISETTSEESSLGAIIPFTDDLPSNSRVRDAALAWLDAARAGSETAFVSYEREWIGHEGAEQRAQRWARMFQDAPEISLDAYSQMNESILTLYVTIGTTQRSLRFAPDMNTPSRLQPIKTRRITLPEGSKP